MSAVRDAGLRIEDRIERLLTQLAIFDLLRVVDEKALGGLHQR